MNQKPHHNTDNETFSVRFAQIRKRDGRLVPFAPARIASAIGQAGQATGQFGKSTAGRMAHTVLGILEKQLPSDEIPTVEQIQDVVEDVLLASPFRKAAKAFVIYRDQHSRIRELTQKADVDLIDSYLDRTDWQVQENSNRSYSLQSLNNHISGSVSKTYWLNKIYSPEIRQAHNSGAIHLHDLGLLSVYCAGWDLRDLLRSGFRGAAGKVESSPPRHFRTALGQIVNFFYTLQGEAAGAQAFSNFDTLLAPFIRHDKLSYKEVKQALQEFIFNINVPTRVGFQSPFTNITLDLQPPVTLANEPVIIGGQLQQETYGEFGKEIIMLNQALLAVMSEGDARGRAFTFPIPTYNITADFDWNNSDLDPLWEVTAKYGIPYFSNFVNADMSPDDTRSMCCRLRLDMRNLEKRGGGLFGANPLTGSIGVVTINMARLGYLAPDETDFRQRLDRLMAIAKTSLETKRKVLEQFTEKNLYPYTRFYLRNIKKRCDRYWHNHFSTIGLIGMNEACLNLIHGDIGTKSGVTLARRVLDHMRRRLHEFQQETGNLYNLEATPAEGATYRLAKLDKQRYPDIIAANEPVIAQGAEPFYTNSTQLPVNYSNDIFEILDLQDELQTRYTGGTVQHIFLGEAVADPQAVKAFVRQVCQTYRLPYFTITPTFSICPEHGYLKGHQSTCPRCNAMTEVYSRVVGYLRPVNQWNQGKQAEFAQRSYYRIGE
ncbi:MAG: ribonucleoside triphosphate reductase [Planctomycetes bacterium]|nr:ribonucleoside triphosphate reductase [Planctomycetota bacterium]